MTLLTIAQNASIKLGIARPSQVIASTDRTMYDFVAITAEAVSDILEAHDWQILKNINTYTGDGVSGSFSLPTNYHRMLRDASVWSSRYLWAMEHIVDSDEWLMRITQPITQVNGTWTVFANLFYLYPTMAVADTAKFFWISNLICASSGGTPQASFMADDDVFRLDEELLRLAIIWRWKSEKGRDYAEDMSNYEIKLKQCIDRDGGSKPTLSGSRYRSWKGRNIAWPGSVLPYAG